MSDHSARSERTPEKNWEFFPDWDENTPTHRRDDHGRARNGTAAPATDKTTDAASFTLRSALKKTSHSRSLGDLGRSLREQPRLTSAQSENSLLSAIVNMVQEAFKFGWNASGRLADHEAEMAQISRMQRGTEAELDGLRDSMARVNTVILQQPNRPRRNSLPTGQTDQDKINGSQDPRHGTTDPLILEVEPPAPSNPNTLGTADTTSSEEIRIDFHGSPEHPCMAGGGEPSDGEEKEFSPQTVMRIKKKMLMQQEKQIELEEEVADLVRQAGALSPSVENYLEQRQSLREMEAAALREIRRRVVNYNSMANLVGLEPKPVEELVAEITLDETAKTPPRHLKQGTSRADPPAPGVADTSKKPSAATLELFRAAAAEDARQEWDRVAPAQPIAPATRPKGAGRGLVAPRPTSSTPTEPPRPRWGWDQRTGPKAPGIAGPERHLREERVDATDVRLIERGLLLSPPHTMTERETMQTSDLHGAQQRNIEAQPPPALTAPLRVQTGAWNDADAELPERRPEVPPRPAPYLPHTDSFRRMDFRDRGKFELPEHNVAFALREWTDPKAMGFHEEHLMYLLDTGHPLFGSNAIRKWDPKFNEHKFPQFKGGLNDDLYQYNRAIRKIVIQHGIWGDTLADLMLTRVTDDVRRQLESFGALNTERPTEVYKLLVEIHAEDNSRETLIREFRTTRQQPGETHARFLVRLVDRFKRAYGTSASLENNYWDRDTFCKQFYHSMEAGRGGVIKAHFKERILDNRQKYHRLRYHGFLSHLKEQLRYALMREEDEELTSDFKSHTRQPQRNPRVLEVNHLQELEEEEVWAVLDHCRKNNLCFNCKEPGHFAADCKNQPQGRKGIYPVKNPEHSRRLKDNEDRRNYRSEGSSKTEHRETLERERSRHHSDAPNEQRRSSRNFSGPTQSQERRTGASARNTEEAKPREGTEEKFLVEMCSTMGQFADLLRRRQNDDKYQSPKGTTADKPAGNQ